MWLSPPPTSLLLREEDQERTSEVDSKGQARTKTQSWEGPCQVLTASRKSGGNPFCSDLPLERRPGRGVPATKRVGIAQVRGRGQDLAHWRCRRLAGRRLGALQQNQAAGSKAMEPLSLLTQRSRPSYNVCFFNLQQLHSHSVERIAVTSPDFSVGYMAAGREGHDHPSWRAEQPPNSTAALCQPSSCERRSVGFPGSRGDTRAPPRPRPV